GGNAEGIHPGAREPTDETEPTERGPVMTVRVAMLTLLLSLAFAGDGRAGADFYLLMFGQQRIPPDPDHSHTFATFVKRTWPGPGPCPPNPCVEAHTISWMPRNMRIRVWAVLPETGQNFNLYPTIQWALDSDMRTSLWGPY